MAAFDIGKTSLKSHVKTVSVLCILWCFLLSGLVAFSLLLKFPFDIISQSLASVKILAAIVTVANVTASFVSSAFRFHGRSVVKCVGLCVLSCIIFYCFAVLFGAPLTEATAETFHFALLMTSLTVVPGACFLGGDLSKWTSVFVLGKSSLGPETVVFITGVSTVVGAWLGAFPIPLDWDRPWQVWPVSCVLGALFAHCLGLLLSALYMPYRYRQLYKMKIT